MKAQLLDADWYAKDALAVGTFFKPDPVSTALRRFVNLRFAETIIILDLTPTRDWRRLQNFIDILPNRALSSKTPPMFPNLKVLHLCEDAMSYIFARGEDFTWTLHGLPIIRLLRQARNIESVRLVYPIPSVLNRETRSPPLIPSDDESPEQCRLQVLRTFLVYMAGLGSLKQVDLINIAFQPMLSCLGHWSQAKFTCHTVSKDELMDIHWREVAKHLVSSICEMTKRTTERPIGKFNFVGSGPGWTAGNFASINGTLPVIYARYEAEFWIRMELYRLYGGRVSTPEMMSIHNMVSFVERA